MVLWVIEGHKWAGAKGLAGSVGPLLMAVLWAVIGIVLMLSYSAFTTGLYCENCSMRPASVKEYAYGLLYALLATCSFIWLCCLLLGVRRTNALRAMQGPRDVEV